MQTKNSYTVIKIAYPLSICWL